jgi:indolepyruvate ferredoxin oxidoreductase
MERQLIADYERTVEELERGLRADNLALAVEVAALPETIRGYGHVKRKNIDAAKAREAALLGQFRNPRAQPMPLAA